MNLDTEDRQSPCRWSWAAVALVSAALALTGCSSKPQPAAKQAPPAATATPAASLPTLSPSAIGESRTYDGAKAAVDKIDATSKANDGGTVWEMMTASGQATMSRADYIKVTQGCPKLITSSTVLSVALDAGGSSATVTISAPPAQGGQPYTYRLIYEASHWKRQPSEAAMGWMGLGADKALIVLRDGGVC